MNDTIKKAHEQILLTHQEIKDSERDFQVLENQYRAQQSRELIGAKLDATLKTQYERALSKLDELKDRRERLHLLRLQTINERAEKAHESYFQSASEATAEAQRIWDQIVLLKAEIDSLQGERARVMAHTIVRPSEVPFNGGAYRFKTVEEIEDKVTNDPEFLLRPEDLDRIRDQYEREVSSHSPSDKMYLGDIYITLGMDGSMIDADIRFVKEGAIRSAQERYKVVKPDPAPIIIRDPRKMDNYYR